MGCLFIISENTKIKKDSRAAVCNIVVRCYVVISINMGQLFCTRQNRMSQYPICSCHPPSLITSDVGQVTYYLVQSTDQLQSLSSYQPYLPCSLYPFGFSHLRCSVKRAGSSIFASIYKPLKIVSSVPGLLIPVGSVTPSRGDSRKGACRPPPPAYCELAV